MEIKNYGTWVAFNRITFTSNIVITGQMVQNLKQGCGSRQHSNFVILPSYAFISIREMWLKTVRSTKNERKVLKKYNLHTI
jgi:hypothetical protein